MNNIFGKRISAFLIDIFFIFIVINLVTQIKFINPTYDKYIENYNNYSELFEEFQEEKINYDEFLLKYDKIYYNISKYSVSYNVVIILVLLLYFGVFQKYNNGQTLGKKIMKLRVVSNTFDNVSLIKYLIRTLPIYYIYIGGIIPLIINSFLVFILSANNYMVVTNIINYIFLFISIISFVMIIVRKDNRGLHDMLVNTKVEYIEK